MCTYHGITVYNVQTNDSLCILEMHIKDFFSIKEIVKKTGIKVKIIQKRGVYFLLKKQAKRKVFYISTFFCLFLLWIGSHFLWGIRLSGNSTVTDDLITDFLQENGVYYGMSLSKIPINDLKTNLRNAYDEITWVSIYLKGTTLHVSIKENDTGFIKNNSVSAEYRDIIADETGIVDSVLVRQGTAMVKAGDSVKKGDILILGKVDIIADDNSIKSEKMLEADGDVYLTYEYPINEQISFEYLSKEYTGNFIDKLEVYIAGKQILFPFSSIPYVKFDSISETMSPSLSDTLSLPLKIRKLRYREYQLIKKKYPHLEAQKLLNEKLDKIILSLEEKGVQIIEKNVKISTNSAYLSLTGTLTLKKNAKVRIQ